MINIAFLDPNLFETDTDKLYPTNIPNVVNEKMILNSDCFMSIGWFFLK